MPFEWWISAFLATLAICISPGNGAVLILRYGLRGGFFYMSPVVFGLQIGLLLVYAAALGILFLFSATISPRVLDIIALLGGGYLFFLGFSDIRQAWRGTYGEALGTGGEALTPVRGKVETVVRRIMVGTVTNLTNPKGIIFMVAFFPQWLRPGAPWPLLWQILALGVMATVTDTIVMHGYGALATRMRVLLKTPSFQRGMDFFLGGVLCVVGVGMILSRLWGA